MIPFRIAESRPARAPRALATRFLEVNLRTYVRAADDEAGIYFFSLEASSLLAVAAARLLYGLPYFPAAMSDPKRGLAHRLIECYPLYVACGAALYRVDVDIFGGNGFPWKDKITAADASLHSP